MQQKINLYLVLPKPPKQYLTNERFAYAYGIFLIILCISYLFDYSQKRDLTHQVAALNITLQKKQQVLTQLSTQYPLLDVKDIAISLQNIQEEIKLRNAILRRPKFSTYLVGLAHTIVPGTWLTEIFISKGGQLITLTGHGLEEKQVQQFLDALRKETVFLKMVLSLDELKRTALNKEGDEYLDFVITCKGDNEE